MHEAFFFGPATQRIFASYRRETIVSGTSLSRFGALRWSEDSVGRPAIVATVSFDNPMPQFDTGIEGVQQSSVVRSR